MLFGFELEWQMYNLKWNFCTAIVCY